jgi:hypothetical protein
MHLQLGGYTLNLLLIDRGSFACLFTSVSEAWAWDYCGHVDNGFSTLSPGYKHLSPVKGCASVEGHQTQDTLRAPTIALKLVSDNPTTR